MHTEHTPMWLAQSPSGCGGCNASESGPRCAADQGLQPCLHPSLSGPQDALQRALGLLNQVAEPGDPRGLVDRQLVRALRIDDGEAELALSFAVRCGQARDLADAAFHALRDALPDTDIYVLPAN